MNDQWDIIGHQKNIAFLKEIAVTKKPVNAYLFCGLENLGKATIAEEFTKELSGKTLFNDSDFYTLKLEEDKKELSIEQVRQFKNYLQLKSFASGYKIGIIYEADKLNQESGNALLKIIEEPSDNTVLIIITSNINKILPTIKSRTQIIKFLPVPFKELSAGLQKKYSQIDSAIIEQAAMAANGKPGKAIEFLLNQNIFNKHSDNIQRIQNILRANNFERWQEVDDYLSQADESIEKSKLASDFLNDVEVILRQDLLRLQQKSIAEKFKFLSLAREQLFANVQPKLILENLLLNI